MARTNRPSSMRRLSGDKSQTSPTSAVRRSRRTFLEIGASASVAAGLMVHSSVAAAEETRELRLGIIGCGGRGAGAANDSLTINDNIKLIAAADLYVSKCA